METNTLSRKSILAAIRQNLPPQRVSRPRIPAFPGPGRPLRLTFKEHLRRTFEEHLTKVGAAAHPVGSPAAAAATRASSSETSGHEPMVNLADRPPTRYLTAKLR